MLYSFHISITIWLAGFISLIMAEIWPISSSPSIKFPSNIPDFALPLPNNSFSSNSSAPRAYASEILSKNEFFTKRTGVNFFNES